MKTYLKSDSELILANGRDPNEPFAKEIQRMCTYSSIIGVALIALRFIFPITADSVVLPAGLLCVSSWIIYIVRYFLSTDIAVFDKSKDQLLILRSVTPPNTEQYVLGQIKRSELKTKPTHSRMATGYLYQLILIDEKKNEIALSDWDIDDNYQACRYQIDQFLGLSYQYDQSRPSPLIHNSGITFPYMSPNSFGSKLITAFASAIVVVCVVVLAIVCYKRYSGVLWP